MIRLLRDFWADKRGTYAMVFALSALPVFGSVAAAVEYSNVFKRKLHLQHALDTAALATAKEIAFNDDRSYLSAYARSFFNANLHPTIAPGDVDFSFDLTNVTGQGTRVILVADHTYDTYMAGILGIEEIDMEVRAVVAAGNRTIEVAIVFDNSGSMDTETGSSGYTRVEKAREAASALVESLHTVASYSNKPDPVKIAVVPFGSSVNVGSKYRGADWLDMNGWSSIHHENITWRGSTITGDDWPGVYQSGAGWKSDSTNTSSVGPNPPNPLPPGVTAVTTNWLTRWTLFDAIQTGWRGCVEMRPWPHHTTDAAPTTQTPDTLFVPMFAPDEPDRENNSEDADYRNVYLDDYIRVGPDFTRTTTSYGNTTKQHRRQFWPRKYNLDARIRDNNGNILIGRTRTNDLGAYGPNQGCTTSPVEPLSTNKYAALNAIAAMQPAGYTNVQEGLAWGWRVLSNGAPFSEGRTYETVENDKIIILMTDGNNTYPSQSTTNQTEYYPWGYGRVQRVLAGLTSWTSNTNAMDQHTATTCANMKAIVDADNEAAYKVFTIAYDVPDGSSVKTLLYNCASVSRSGVRYYYDVQGDALTAVMAAIGNEISQLRIAQ